MEPTITGFSNRVRMCWNPLDKCRIEHTVLKEFYRMRVTIFFYRSGKGTRLHLRAYYEPGALLVRRSCDYVSNASLRRHNAISLCGLPNQARYNKPKARILNLIGGFPQRSAQPITTTGYDTRCIGPGKLWAYVPCSTTVPLRHAIA